MAATSTDPAAGRPPAAAGDPPPPQQQAARQPTPPRVLFGELTSAVGALALLIVLFATEWYGVAGVPDPSAARPAISSAESGWDGLTLVRWVLLATIVVTLGSLLLHASQRRHGSRTDTSRVVTALGSLSALLLVYRVLIALPSPDRVIDQKLGALLGLLCAVAIALGGFESIAEHRIRSRKLVRRGRRMAHPPDRA